MLGLEMGRCFVKSLAIGYSRWSLFFFLTALTRWLSLRG